MKMLETLSRWLGYVSAVVIIIMMLLVTGDVCGRYFFNNPISGTGELICFMMIIIVFPALAWTALVGKHIRVGMIVDRFPPRVQAIFDSVTLLVALGLYTIIGYQGALRALIVPNKTSMLGVPHAPFYWIMTVGWAIFCISIIALEIKNIATAVKR